MRTLTVPASLLIAAVLLTGCAAPAAEPVAEETEKSNPYPSRDLGGAAWEQDYSFPAYSFTLACSTESGATFDFDTFVEAQTFQAESGLEFDDCTAENESPGTLTDVEQEAVRAADYIDFDGITTLHALCAERRGYYVDNPELSEAQIAEYTGVLTLCPNHPDAAAIQAKIGTSIQVDAERAAGLRFRDGIYKLGVDIQPGTYAIDRPVEDCYWERTDSSGDIIDNDFISGAARVEVTIQPSDYSFYANRCGEWVRVP